MCQFIGLVWDRASPLQREHAAHIARRLVGRSAAWRRVFAGTGVILLRKWTRRTDVQETLLPAGGGVILGTLFRRSADGTSATTEVSGSDGMAVVATGGRCLGETVWGQYVAFVVDEPRGACHVLRDPSGRVPCFLTTSGGVDVCFSDVGDLVDIGVVTPSVNWRYVAAHLVYDRIQIRETGLSDVFELQAGERVTLAPDHAPQRAFYWDPVRLHDRRPIREPDLAAAELKSTVTQCVHAWASRHRSIIHQLSGGLDSAIVLDCLRSAPSRPAITCLNFSTPSAEGDERRYARAAAAKARVELIETTLDPSEVNLADALNVARFPRPVRYAYSIADDAIEADIAYARGAEACYSAAGGDNLFFQAKADVYPADYFRDHGLRAGVLQVVMDTARLTGASFWSVLWHTVGYAIGTRRFDRYRQLLEYVGPLDDGVREEVTMEYITHPWLNTAAQLPHGKRRHIFAMIDCQNYFYPFRRARVADIMFPLLSQPLVELCLQIPSYVLTSGGQDRTLARRAFSEAVPAEILARRTKGQMGAYYNAIVLKNLRFIRELLLDGQIARQGLFNRAALEDSLTESALVRGRGYSRILDYVCVEAWARSLTPARRRAAA